MNTEDTLSLVEELAGGLMAQGWFMTTAESCTGGLIAAACTELAGSSAWFERGVVSYSNEAKTELLGVPPALIAEHGAVSEPVARAMAEGALKHCARAHIAVAVTGIAGPGGGSPDKPVGTVWLAWALRGVGADAGACASQAERHQYDGDRAQVRRATCRTALQGLIDRLGDRLPPAAA